MFVVHENRLQMYKDFLNYANIGVFFRKNPTIPDGHAII